MPSVVLVTLLKSAEYAQVLWRTNVPEELKYLNFCRAVKSIKIGDRPFAHRVHVGQYLARRVKVIGETLLAKYWWYKKL